MSDPLKTTDLLTTHVMEKVTATFTSLFGKPLDLWLFEGGCWHHVVDAVHQELSPELLEVALILPESLPRGPGENTEPVVEEIASGVFRIEAQILVAMELTPEIIHSVVVAGTIQNAPQLLMASVLRLGAERQRLAQEVAEYRQGLDPHLEQISHDFEELTFLRRLSEQVDFSNVCDPLIDLAQGILPDLLSLVQAESVVLVGVGSHDDVLQEDDEEGVPDRACRNSKSLSVGRALLCSGEQLLDDFACAKLIEDLRAESEEGRPLVINRSALGAGRHLPPNIQSCIQIAVMHRNFCYGWLLAFNRNIHQPLAVGHNSSQKNMLGYDEFGTSEASLMSSASSTLAAHAHSADLFREREFMLIGVIRSLISAIDAKDIYTCGHSDRVALTGRCIAEHMSLSPIECERIYMSGLLHDIGKIGIPDEVLLKPGKLTDAEYKTIKRHPSIGYAILKHMPQLRHVLPGVLHHHESVDGKGYPHGLKGDAIPLIGRILAVADAYDAMTSDRPYRSGMSVEKAVSILKDGAGQQWDAQVVEAFLDALPAVEAATKDSSRRVRELLRKASESGTNISIDSIEMDNIARAVAIGST